MQSSRTEEAFPWLGIAALTAAGVGVVLLLAGPFSVFDVLQTWSLSRASGFVAYLLLWASACLGLVQALGLVRPVSAAERIDLHAFLSLGALYMTVFHAVILLWDGHLSFRWADILIPFHSARQPVLVGFGIVAFYFALAAALTTYLRGRLSPLLWRAIHQVTLVAFCLAFLHGTLLGTDAGLPLARLMYAETGTVFALLTAARLIKG